MKYYMEKDKMRAKKKCSGIVHKITAEDFEILAQVQALAETVGVFSTIVQNRTNLWSCEDDLSPLNGE
jgi:hypothetical protein